MPSAIIVPVAKSLYLCDGTIGIPGGKTDVVGVFNSISPPSYPHVQQLFVVYARLSAGLGQVPFFIDLRLAVTGQLLHATNVKTLNFPNRNMTVEMAMSLRNILFPQPGVYLLELYCDNQWLADATLLLQ